MAACIRVYYMARACQLAGYETLVIGKGKLSDENNDICEYKGVAYTTMQRAASNQVKNLLTFRKRRRLYTEYLKKYASDAKFIIPYACSCPSHMKKIIQFGKATGIRVICDITEWYSFRQFTGLIGKIYYLIFQYSFRHVFFKCDKMICCSKLVKSFFEKKNSNILILHGIMDASEFLPAIIPENKKTVFVYAGSPGRKDLLRQFISALEILDEEIANKIEFNIIGLSQHDIAKMKKQYGERANMYPRMPREKLKGIIKNADFSILLRPNLRYANAGFPSKLCESMAMGTPMMANITGDIGDYLSESNAIIIHDTSVKSVMEAMIAAVRLERDKYLGFRHEALQIAKNNFDISVWSARLKEFLEA